MENNEKKIITGKVVSSKSDKTLIVEVSRIKTNRLYKKKYKVTKKFSVHDERNEYKVGDIVEIISVRPISKTKFYKVSRKV